MEIKEYKTKHLEQIMDIENRSFKCPYDRRIFQSYTGSPLFLVGLENEEVLGYAMGTRSGVIVSIAVDPNHRRKGIGEELMDKLFEKMKVQRMTLTVRTSNKGAYQFYKKLGFKPRKKIPDYYENGEDALFMSKDK